MFPVHTKQIRKSADSSSVRSKPMTPLSRSFPGVLALSSTAEAKAVCTQSLSLGQHRANHAVTMDIARARAPNVE